MKCIPTRFRKEFRTNGLRAHVRRRIRGNSMNYEIRCRAQGYNICASGKTIEEAKARFFEKLKEADQKTKAPSIPTGFIDFTSFYIENYRKRKISKTTLLNDNYRLKKHIFPHFQNMNLKTITPILCQQLIDKLVDEGKEKTADEVHSMMNGIFKYAIAHDVINKNPLATVFKLKHECKHGKALTKKEETYLLSLDSPYRIYYIIALYTGMRPNEYPTARIQENMIIAVNSKRKHKRVEYKRIPINPMLAPYIQSIEKFEFPAYWKLKEEFKRLMPNHTLYNLRTTFYTRCRECGVGDAARDEMVGHSSGILSETYTDLSDEYLIKEASKILYDLPPILPPKVTE